MKNLAACSALQPSNLRGVVESREEAIRRAVTIAIENDIILVAGKGHEDYQIIGDRKLPFDDSKVLSTYLNQI